NRRSRVSFMRIRSGECATPRDVLEVAIGSGAGEVLLEDGALPASFFELRSGAAGDLVQGLVNYRIRMAAVLPSTSARSDAFRAFVTEENRGNLFRFFESEDAAREWLGESSVI